MPSDKLPDGSLITIWRNDINGSTAIEYALIAGGLSIVVAGIVFILGTDVSDHLFAEIAAFLTPRL